MGFLTNFDVKIPWAAAIISVLVNITIIATGTYIENKAFAALRTRQG